MLNLPSPISIRSHFLINTPLIAIEKEYIGKEAHTLESFYVNFHEYLHYEDYISWPLTSMNYFWNVLDSIHNIHQLRSKNRRISSLYEMVLQWKSVSLKFESDIILNTENKFQIKRVGIGVLMEMGALLDYKLKPQEFSLKQYSEDVIKSLLNNPSDSANAVHYAGVSSCIKAVDLLRANFYRDYPKTFQHEETFEALTATLPKHILIRAFGYSMTLCGYKGGSNWKDVFSFVNKNFIQIWNLYLEKVNVISHDAFVNYKTDEVFEFIMLRDISLVGIHAFMTVMYSLVSLSAKSLFGDTELATRFLYPLSNIVRTHEALDLFTLESAGYPNLNPHWAPVPVISFADRHMTSLRVDTSDPKASYLRWGESSKDTRDGWIMYQLD